MAISQGKETGGLMPTLTVILLLSLVGAGIGFAVGVFLQPGERPAASSATSPEAQGKKSADDGPAPAADAGATEDHSGDAAGSEAVVDADLKIIPLPPVVTTLAAPEGKWIRLEGSILADPGAGAPELLAEKAGEQILAYLRTVKLEQVQGPSGFLALRDDLNDTVSTLSNGEVRAVLIHGLLVE